MVRFSVGSVVVLVLSCSTWSCRFSAPDDSLFDDANTSQDTSNILNVENFENFENFEKYYLGKDGDNDDDKFISSYSETPCSDLACLDLAALYPNCAGNMLGIWDGWCDSDLNNPSCGYDGGDCCSCSCNGGTDYACSSSDFNCLDPGAAVEIYDCEESPAELLPCSTEIPTEWVVQDTTQATSLAEAVKCSGGVFDVEWKGNVVVENVISVGGGTMLNIKGIGVRPTMDGNASTRLFTVVNASLHVSNVDIVQGASIVGGAIATAGSVVTLNRTAFVGNTARYRGGALFVSNGSSVSFAGETVSSSNSANSSGGALFVSDGSSVSFAGQTNFSRNSADIYGGAVYASDSSVSWKGNVTFVSNAAGSSGGALMATDTSTVAWSGATTFEGNRAREVGGALGVFSATNVSWTAETSFFQNIAESAGGALYSGGCSIIRWDGPTGFSFNDAENGGAMFVTDGSSVGWTGPTDFASNTAASGGAVGSAVFDASDNTRNSDLAINATTSFVNNTCRVNGGAMALLGTLSLSFDAADVTFVENSAAVAGGSVFISGAGVGPVFSDAKFSSNSAQSGGAVYVTGSGTTVTKMSGNDVSNPTTFIGCTFVANEASATGGAIETAAGQDVVANTVFVSNRASVGGALRLGGIASLTNCSFTENASNEGGGAAVSNIGVMSQVSNIDFIENTFICRDREFLDHHTASGGLYQAVCTGCPSQCDDCTLGPSPRAPKCSDVMEHSNSSGGAIRVQDLWIQPGYWRATNTSKDVLACYNAGACLGGVTGSRRYCANGYEGPYCSICSDGHMASARFTCTKCSESRVCLVLGVGVSVTIVLLLALVSHLTSAESEVGGRGAVGRMAQYVPFHSLKIIIVVWQILTQFAIVANVTYPGAYEFFLDLVGVFNFDLGWILSAGCIFDIDFHACLLMSTIGPIIAMAFLGATYAVAVCRNRGSEGGLHDALHKHVSMVLLLTFLVYSSVSSTMFQMFACETLDDRKNYLRADYSIICSTPRHKALQIYTGFTIVLYTVGIPVLYSHLLFSNHRVLKETIRREGNLRVRLTSDLSQPYKPERYYYEVIECGRRVLLAGGVVFIYPNTAAQVAVTLMLAMFFVFVSEGLAPHASRWDLWLSRTGHAVVLLSMYMVLLLKAGISSDRATSQKVFAAMLVSANVFMVLAVVVEIITARCSLTKQETTRAMAPLRRQERFRWSREESLNRTGVSRDDANDVADVSNAGVSAAGSSQNSRRTQMDAL